MPQRMPQGAVGLNVNQVPSVGERTTYSCVWRRLPPVARLPPAITGDLEDVSVLVEAQ